MTYLRQKLTCPPRQVKRNSLESKRRANPTNRRVFVLWLAAELEQRGQPALPPNWNYDDLKRRLLASWQ